MVEWLTKWIDRITIFTVFVDAYFVCPFRDAVCHDRVATCDIVQPCRHEGCPDLMLILHICPILAKKHILDYI